jgi:cytochrome P450
MPSIDEAIVDPKLYADASAYHALFASLRRDAPVRWTEPQRFRPFWTVSRHADIMEIERQSERFLNGPRLNLMSRDMEERVKAHTGRAQIIRTLVDLDDPEHRALRGLTQSWFLPGNLRTLSARIDALAAEFVDRLERLGGECDFVKDVAVWYPLRVIMIILGVPPEDEALMLKLTQELLAPLDKDMRTRAEGRNLISTVEDFFAYFRQIAAERRREPRDDVASVIANATIDGQPLGEVEAMSYYIIIATAGHDTTSSTAAGGLLALIENPEQLAKLRANPAHIPSAIDEMVRWVSPVAHFFRTAAQDYELRGQQIRLGDALMMCYPSANRDEAVFDEPFAFRIDRSPNRHLAFGYGPHLCLGQHLAKLELRALFKELLSRLDRIELAGPPAWTESYFVGGLKRLPIRYTLRR